MHTRRNRRRYRLPQSVRLIHGKSMPSGRASGRLLRTREAAEPNLLPSEVSRRSEGPDIPTNEDEGNLGQEVAA